MPIRYECPKPVSPQVAMALQTALAEINENELTEDNFDRAVSMMSDLGVLLLIDAYGNERTLYEIGYNDAKEYEAVVDRFLRPLIGFMWSRG